jgi:uncharacterized protein YpbB
MFRLGKNITEIAKERGLVSSTIEGHLVSFIPTGEVKINELISDKEMTILKEAIEKSSEKTVVAVKQIVGNDFSYAIVRALLNEKN